MSKKSLGHKKVYLDEFKRKNNFFPKKLLSSFLDVAGHNYAGQVKSKKADSQPPLAGRLEKSTQKNFLKKSKK